MTIEQLLALTDSLYPNGATDATKVGYFNMCQNELSAYFGYVAEDTSLYTVAGSDSYAFPASIEDVSQIITFDIYNEVTDIDSAINQTTMQADTTYNMDSVPQQACRISVTHTANGDTDTLGNVAITGSVNGVSTTETLALIANDTVEGRIVFDAGTVTQIETPDWVTDGDSADDYISVGTVSDREDFTRYSPGYIDDDRQSGNVYYQIYTSTGTKSIVLSPVPTTSGCRIRIRYRRNITPITWVETEPEV